MIVEEISAQEFLQIRTEDENSNRALESREPNATGQKVDEAAKTNADAEPDEKTRIEVNRKTQEQLAAAAHVKAYAEEQFKLEAAALAQKDAERNMLETADLLSKSADVADIAMAAE